MTNFFSLDVPTEIAAGADKLLPGFFIKYARETLRTPEPPRPQRSKDNQIAFMIDPCETNAESN